MNVKQRIAIEKRIVRKTVNALLEAGYQLNIWEDGDYRLPKGTTDKAIIMAELMATDEDVLVVADTVNGRTFGRVFFIYGNDGYDVINDYTTNLEAIIGPICDYAETPFLIPRNRVSLSVGTRLSENHHTRSN